MDRKLQSSEISEISLHRCSDNKCNTERDHDSALGSIGSCCGISGDTDQYHYGIPGSDQRVAAKCKTDVGGNKVQGCVLTRKQIDRTVKLKEYIPQKRKGVTDVNI